MKFIVIEDEQLAAKRLRAMIEKLRPDYEFVAKFDSVESATISLPVLKYDLLFMDIQLADGNSFDIFDQIKVKSPIIFTTAYDQYAVKAFKANSVDYLLKPIDEKELENAIKKFEENFRHKKSDREESNSQSDIVQLIKSMQPKGKERFVVRVGEHLKTIDTSDVKLVYSSDKATYIFTKQGRKYLIDFSVDKADEVLSSEKFFKISRKFIINLDYIKDIIAFTNSRLEVVVDQFEEEQVIVARERVGQFKEWLDQ
jgi:DNA-binding LytR/AlgR family response regulator